MDIKIDYFPNFRRKMDMDNITKCIMDALNGVAYGDDQQVRIQRSSAHDLLRKVRMADCPIDLVKPLKDYEEYLFVRVTGA